MAEERQVPRPVQVFLDTRRFIERQEPREFGGGNRDFFSGNDRGFDAQKRQIRKRLQDIAQELTDRKDAAGFIRVQMREDALGKSYRPIGSLFTGSNGFALVGAGRIGEMIFQVTPSALLRLDRRIEEKAEATPRQVLNEKTSVIEFRVSGYRSEVGAIANISLHDHADRVAFSAKEAVAWLDQPNIIGGYIIELFRPNVSAAPEAINQLTDQFYKGLAALPSGVRARPFLASPETQSYGEGPLALTIQLVRNSEKDLSLPLLRGGGEFVPTERSRSPITVERDLTPAHHEALLNMLAEQALVRSVSLPPLVEAAPAAIATGVVRPNVSRPMANSSYPVVGIIDGGVSDIAELAPWCAGDAGLVPRNDRDESHGTFIAGLVVAGATLNPHLAGKLEPLGCKFYDLDIFPRRELRHRYFDGDIDFFFDLLDEKIKTAKRDYGVRVFNLSFGLKIPGAQFGYSPLADRLDRVARSNDVIMVVSAGNLAQGDTRPPWSRDPQKVISMLASFGSNAQKIVPPSEHLLGLTVGAINPPGLRGHEMDLPTTYTRRGPGIGGARKPDISHYGGAEASSSSGNRTGLASLAPSGDTVENCGTSFAAPNAAATLATLDHRLEGAQPREILMALPIHRASRGPALSHTSLRHISREFVGFGLPPICDEILMDDPYSISLIFNETLHGKRKLEFPFAWPAELVNSSGGCRGRVDITLAFTPPIDADHKDEALRVHLEAHLYQETIDPETGETGWDSRLAQDGSGVPQGMNKTESYLLKTGLKWSPVKKYQVHMPQGRGSRSNWRLCLDSLTRAGARYPSEGVSFALIMTISDPKRSTPIHDAVRNSLQARGLTIADITVAHRVRPRKP